MATFTIVVTVELPGGSKKVMNFVGKTLQAAEARIEDYLNKHPDQKLIGAVYPRTED